MARALSLLALGAAVGCFHADPYSSRQSVDAWRAMEASQARPGAADRARSDAPDGALTAEQTYELAVRNNVDVASLAAEAEVIAAQVQAARQLDNPQLRITNFDADDAIARQGSANIGIRMPIPRPGTVRARVEQAKLAAQSAKGDTESAKRELRGSIHKLFATLAMLRADLEHASRLSELQAELRRHVAERFDRAVATKLELALADVEHAEAKDAEADLREEIALIEAELQRLSGAGVPLRFRADASELRLVDVELDRDALIERAMEARPELEGGHAEIGAAKAEVYLARSEAWPWFEWVQVHYRAGPTSTAASWGFGIALTLPILSWNRGEVKAAKALVRQREVEQRTRIAAVASDVDEAVTRIERTAARVHELETGLLLRADEAAREAEAALASTSIDPVDAHEIRVRGIAARRVHAAALLAHREAVIDLETVVGAPLTTRPRR